MVDGTCVAVDETGVEEAAFDLSYVNVGRVMVIWLVAGAKAISELIGS